MKLYAFIVALCGFVGTYPLGAQAQDLLATAGSATPAEIRQALDRGADPNAVDAAGRTVLMIAAASNPDPAAVSALVKAGARVNARGPHSWTALMMAAYNNPNPHVVSVLLDLGADPRLRSDVGRTAYGYAQDNDKLAGTEALRRLKTASR